MMCVGIGEVGDNFRTPMMVKLLKFFGQLYFFHHEVFSFSGFFLSVPHLFRYLSTLAQGSPYLRVKVSSDAPCGCPVWSSPVRRQARTGHPQGASLLAP